MAEVHHHTIFFSGRVQGVGFRYATAQVARQFEVAGFVANLPDGRVRKADGGYGERLLQACEARAREGRIRRLFALTTRAQHWFIAQGFREAGVDVLPEQRKALYNWKRGSKVFLKRI